MKRWHNDAYICFSLIGKFLPEPSLQARAVGIPNFPTQSSQISAHPHLAELCRDQAVGKLAEAAAVPAA